MIQGPPKCPVWDPIFVVCMDGDLPPQVLEEQFHGVVVGFGELMDQFLQGLNLLCGLPNFCWQGEMKCFDLGIAPSFEPLGSERS